MIKKISYLLLISIIFILFNCNDKSSLTIIELNEGWEFKSSDDSLWYDAKVPGTVHTDLIKQNIIKDPFYRTNEHDLQWIDKKDWVYQTTFDVSNSVYGKENIELDFAGLDTYASVYLNDSLILKSDNMYRSFNITVKDLLKPKDNKLRVLFESPIKIGIQKYDSLSYKFPDFGNDLAEIGKVEGNKKVSVFTRKAPYHFGWDWGPRLVTSGIWKPIKLKSWDRFIIEDVFIKQKSIDDNASLVAEVDVIYSGKNDKKYHSLDIYVNKELIKTSNLILEKGINNFQIPFIINSPNLWWPNGMGDQYLYDVEVKLSDNSYVDSKSHKIGLRTVELIREKDSIGKSFYFKVNGHPVFMKGANYIPQDIFLTRPQTIDYESILSSAKESNMNMIRVWGGGVYESSEFYEMCDEKGLLVWQDFMFACAVYPGDKDFLENVKQEAIDNVKRLRNHPSIALWCGNNENLSAWENWGWKNEVIKNQSKAIADTIWKSYEDVFHKILPDVVNTYDSNRSYWPSSPGSDFGKTENLNSGDAHYWWVWWGKKPFEDYNKDIPRFMSEFGFQSFPEFSSVERFTIAEDHNIYSEVMKSHQRSSIGNETIEEYMLRDYRKPKDFESFLYVSQLLQARGLNIGIEAQRRHRERCMGTLYWQINDCWPVASWYSIDYYGKWKALQYKIKKSFKTFLITQESNNDKMEFFIVSDSLDFVDAQIKLNLLDFKGNSLNKWTKKISINPNQSKKYLEISEDLFSSYGELDNMLINAKLISSFDTLLAENNIYFKSPKMLNLPNVDISFEIFESKDNYEIILKSQNLAKNVFISSILTGNFSDNYFDLLPGDKKIISIDKNGFKDFKLFKSSVKVVSLRDTY